VVIRIGTSGRTYDCCAPERHLRRPRSRHPRQVTAHRDVMLSSAMCSRATAAISGDSSMPTTPPCAPALSRSKPQHSPFRTRRRGPPAPGGPALPPRSPRGRGWNALVPPSATGKGTHPYRWKRAALRQTPDLAQSRIRADLPVLGIECVAIGHVSRLADHAFQVLRNMASLAETCSRNMGCRSIDGEYLLAGTSRPSASAIART
jgi:hypothetical protein